MPDYLSCGSCQADFQLSDITNFIEHKTQHCGERYASTNGSSATSVALLECTRCLRKFSTPWPLLLHLQTDHRMSIVRNILLPNQDSYSISSLPVEEDSLSKKSKTTCSTQTVRSCLKKEDCPFNLSSDCCLKKEMEVRSMQSCCRTRSTSSSSGPIPPCCSIAAADSKKSSKRSKSREICCNDDRPPSVESTTVSVSQTRSKSPSCCRPSPPCTRSRTASNDCPGRTMSKKRRLLARCCPDSSEGSPDFSASQSPSCCSDPGSVARSTSSGVCDIKCSAMSPVKTPVMDNKDCQTDFVDPTFDIDVDLLLEGGLDDDMGENQGTSDVIQRLSYVPPAPSKAIQTISYLHQQYAEQSLQQNMSLTPAMLVDEQSTSFQPTASATTSSGNGFLETVQTNPVTSYQTNSPLVGFTIIDNGKSQNQQQFIQPLTLNAGDTGGVMLNMLGGEPAPASAPNAASPPVSSASHISPSTPPRKRYKDFRFTCGDCQKPFKQNVHLRKHIQSQHTKLKPHKCPYCAYTTVEKSHLTVHIRTHTGEKPFHCRLCDYSTAQNCTLKSHYLRRHPGCTIQCEMCSETFITEHEKEKHEKMCREMQQQKGTDSLT